MKTKTTQSNELDNVNLLRLENDDIDFPSMCKFIRSTLKVTQQQVAEKLEVNTRTYRYWESGTYVPKSWQAINLGLLYVYAKERASRHTSQDSQQEAA